MFKTTLLQNFTRAQVGIPKQCAIETEITTKVNMFLPESEHIILPRNVQSRYLMAKTLGEIPLDDNFFIAPSYLQWIRGAQRIWRTLIRNRSALSALEFRQVSTITAPREGKNVGEGALHTLAERSKRRVLSSCWHVLRAFKKPNYPSSEEAYLTCLVDQTEMYTFPIRVPRVFLVNSKTPLSDLDSNLCRLVTEKNIVLPRNAQLHHLYELTVPSHMDTDVLLRQLYCCSDDVCGVYESNVDIVTKALLKFGNCVRVLPKPGLKEKTCR